MALFGEKQNQFNVINRTKPRMDGVEKVTGKSRYAADIYMENMLYAGVLRSGRASAKVLSINADKARALDGVAQVVTCFDLPKCRSWAGYMYLTDIIRYAGDCVAMVAAETKDLVEEALELIEAEYQDLPAVFTLEEAMAEGAPAVHEKYPDNRFTDSEFFLKKGDIDQGFAMADVIIEREYHTQFIEHSYIEPEAVVAYPNYNDGIMTVHASAQNPFFTRRYVADILNAPMNKVRLIQETLGGSFGGKEEGVGLVAGRCAYLSKLTKRPVKMVFSREDSFLESAKRHPFWIRYKAGVKKDGTLVAWEGSQIDNAGAYNNQTQFMNWRANLHSSGPYVIPHISTHTVGVFTNNIHGGAMRGYSSPSLIFAQEQFIDELAEEIGMDEIAFRRKNCLKSGDETATGAPVDHVILEDMICHTVKQTDYTAKHAQNRSQTSDQRFRKGIGLSISYRSCGFGAEAPDASGCMMLVHEDGSVNINSGLAENGQGLKTAYAQIAAETIGVNYEDVFFYGTDTFSIPDCGMTVASRGTVMGAQSVRKAGEQLRTTLLENTLKLQTISIDQVVAHYGDKAVNLSYETTTIDDLDLQGGKLFFKAFPEVTCPLSAMTNSALWCGLPTSSYAWYRPEEFHQDHHTGQGKAAPTFSYGCIVAEVEVDTKTGYVDLKKVTASHDVGTAINPALIRGQVYGGILMGQGYGITEEVNVSKGRVKDHNFDSYIIPTSMDAPEMEINLFECDDPAGTYGAKSIGEPATEAVAAAIANAVYNATGRRIRENPCTLESVLLGKKL